MEAAIHQADQFIEAGAEILDIGGESTRPGSQTVDAYEEMKQSSRLSRQLHPPIPRSLFLWTPTKQLLQMQL